MSNQSNRYYNLGKIFEEPVDYNLVKDFIQNYIVIAEKSGRKPNDVISDLKNFSTELHDAILTNCVKLQSELPSESIVEAQSDWVLVKDAADIFSVTSATIRNWINKGEPPLEHKKLSDRKTLVSMKDIRRFALIHR